MTAWMVGAAFMHAQHCGQPRAGPSSAADDSQESMGARVVLWLAACAVLGPTPGGSVPQPRTEIAAAAAAGKASRLAAAQKLLMLQATLPPGEQHLAGLVALLLHLLQPTIGSMLGLPPEDPQADPGPPAESAPRWRFLLGNTLLRLLERLPLPEDRALQWWRTAAAMQPAEVIEEPGPMAPEAAAARELAAVLLSELCMGQEPHLTCSSLRHWAGGACGPARQAIADVELLHAQAVSLDF